MPGLNKTGPSGQGPLTGRRMGQCAGNENDNTGFGRGMGRGSRGGRFGGGGRGQGQGSGRGFGFFGFGGGRETPGNESVENEINSLKSQISFLEKQFFGKEKSD